MHTRNMIVIAALVAACGTAANAQSISWLMPVDGNWNDAANWAGGNIPDSVSEEAVFGLADPFTVFTTNNWSLGSMSISNPNATLSIGTNQHTLQGDLFNDGTVVVNTNASVFNGTLFFNADAMISGSGSIVLNGTAQVDDANLSVDGDNTATNATGHTIRGSGRLLGSINNNGTVVADIPGAIGLQLDGTLDQTGGGSAGADGGVLRLGSSGMTIGGELFTLNGGEIRAVANNHQLDAVTISGDLVIPGEGRNLLLVSNNTINGVVAINPTGSVFNATLRIDADLTIDGTGSIDMTTAGNFNDAEVAIQGAHTLTLGSGLTVQGSGLLNASTSGTMINHGTIIANDPNHQLGLEGAHIGDGGTYLADGGVMSFRNNAVVSNAAFDSANGGAVEHNIGGSATISNISNDGVMIVRGNGGTLKVDATITNNGSIALNPEDSVFNANLKAETSSTIAGPGAVTMTAISNSGDARVHATDGAILTIAADQTIAGSGLIETDAGLGSTIVNLGTINGNFAAVGMDPAYPLQLRGNHDGMGQGVYRSDDGILQLGNGLTLNNAEFDSSGVGFVGVTNGDTATLGNITNTGDMRILGQGGKMTLVDELVNNGTITINSNASVFNATLELGTTLAEINGSGEIRMITAGNLNDAQLIAVDTVGSIGANQTVAGSGIIEGRGTGIISNSGTIIGDDPAAFLQLRGVHNASASAVYRADGDGVLSLGNGVSVNSGTFETTGNGEVAATGGLSSIGFNTNNGILGIRGQGATLSLFGPITNNGMIHINSDSAVFNAKLRFTGDFEIDGTGTIEMTTAGNPNDAQLAAETGFVGTLGSGQTLTGDGQINGAFNILGTIDPGGPSRLLTTDTIDLDPGSIARFDLGGANPGEFDRISVRSAQTLNLNNATINIGIEPGFAPQFGDTWDIITGDTTGIFSEVIATNAPIGQVYRPIYENDRVFVILTCDADLTGNGVVDFFDVSAFLGFFNSQDIRGDLNNDGQFNFFDISLFLQLLGKGCNP